MSRESQLLAMEAKLLELIKAIEPIRGQLEPKSQCKMIIEEEPEEIGATAAALVVAAVAGVIKFLLYLNSASFSITLDISRQAERRDSPSE